MAFPVYRMLGGRFRDRIRMYCDTDVGGRDTGTAMGNALKLRMERGFTFLKMDLESVNFTANPEHCVCRTVRL